MTEKQKTFLYHFEMEIGKTKEEAIYLKTSEIDKQTKKIIPIYNSIYDAWQATKDYRQTSAGLNHYRRDVVVADFDGPESDFHSVFDKLNLPTFSYIIKNKDTGHIQAGYVLNQPFIWSDEHQTEKQIYLDCKFNLNSYCPDNGYKGWRIKNPFCPDFETIFNNVSYDKNFIVKILLNLKKNSKSVENKSKPTKNKKIINNDNKMEKKSVKQERTAGRNNYFHFRTMKFYSSLKSQQIEFSERDLLNWLIDNETNFRNELLAVNPNVENANLERKELETIVRSARNYVEQHFDPSKNSGWENCQRENSLTLRQFKSERDFLEFCDYYEHGNSIKQICESLGFKKSKAYEFKKDYEELKEKNLLDYFRICNGFY